jgi:uncharacterized protein (DUF885 family)
MARPRYTLSVLSCLGLGLLLPRPGGAGDDPAVQLRRIVEQYYDDFLELNPGFATLVGDHRFNDRLAIDIGADHRRRSLELEKRALQKIEAIDRAALDTDQRLTRDLFIHGRRQAIEGYHYPSHLMPVDHLHSRPVLLALLGSGGSAQPFNTVEDYENWLDRLRTWIPWVEQAIANMREGLSTGITQAWSVTERALPLLETHIIEDPGRSLFWAPIDRLPSSFSDQDQKRLEIAYSRAIRDQIVPGYQRLLDFMRKEYLPQARTGVGLSELPNGAAWYAFLVRSQTTTDLTPAEIHRIGKREVTRITGEIKRFERTSRRAEERSASPSRAYLLEGYRSLRARVEPRLSNLFATIPESDFEIRPVEEFRRASAPGASYVAGLPDGSRPGCFYVNADEETPGEPSDALFLHEAIPGHHFQISIQRQRQALPRFRRFGQVTAFVEGWALYAESLGEELGLYRDRNQKIRALRSELFRARRLVVDTGIHALGWSRERAIEYLGSSREVDRYIAWPGQALAYKIGEMRISSLRSRAEKTLGRSFDVRQFHDAVLTEGAIPLDILEARIVRWAAEQEAASAQ